MEISFENDQLVIRISCATADIKAASVSKSGKSKMVASTGGFVAVEGAPEGVKLSLNLIAPK